MPNCAWCKMIPYRHLMVYQTQVPWLVRLNIITVYSWNSLINSIVHSHVPPLNVMRLALKEPTTIKCSLMSVTFVFGERRWRAGKSCGGERAEAFRSVFPYTRLISREQHSREHGWLKINSRMYFRQQVVLSFRLRIPSIYFKATYNRICSTACL